MPSLFAKISISKKLIAAFLLVGIIPLMVLGLTTLDSASKALEKQSLNQLETVRSIKKGQIEAYFKSTQEDLGILSKTIDRTMCPMSMCFNLSFGLIGQSVNGVKTSVVD